MELLNMLSIKVNENVVIDIEEVSGFLITNVQITTYNTILREGLLGDLEEYVMSNYSSSITLQEFQNILEDKDNTLFEVLNIEDNEPCYDDREEEYMENVYYSRK